MSLTTENSITICIALVVLLAAISFIAFKKKNAIENIALFKNKPIITVLFILLALPIPLSLITWIATIMAIASPPQEKTFIVIIVSIISLIAMLLAGTYPISYIVALIHTIAKKKLSLLSFLPIIHVIVFCLFFLSWYWVDNVKTENETKARMKIEYIYDKSSHQEFKIQGNYVVFVEDISVKNKTDKDINFRSEERRVGKECRSRWSPYH